MKSSKIFIGDIVQIINVNLLDCYNPETGEKDVYFGDKFKVLDVIEFEDDEADLMVESLRFKTVSIINSERFVKLDY